MVSLVLISRYTFPFRERRRKSPGDPPVARGEEGFLQAQATDKTSTIVMSLATAVENASRTLHLGKDAQHMFYDEVRRCVVAQSRITVLAAWFLNVFFAWVSDYDLEMGNVAINHAFFVTACTLVNNLDRKGTGDKQPLLQRCFTEVFAPLVPKHVWPKFTDGGVYHAAIARTFDANYQVYSSIGLDLHAIAYLREEDKTDPTQKSLPKWLAKEAWERAKHLYPSNDQRDYMIEAWFKAFLKSLENRPVTKDEHEAEQLAILMRKNHLRAHRQMLDCVEERQANAMDVDGQTNTTGKTFPLFPLYNIEHHFAVLDQSNTFLKDRDSEDVMRALLPVRKG